MRTLALAALPLVIFSMPSAALAAPGLGSEVYGATVKAGEPEAEVRYDVLTGGPDDGEGVIKLEAGYGVSRYFRLGLLGEFEREPGDVRRAEELGIEGIWALGRVRGVDVAIYGEYALGLNGRADKVEGKLLLERSDGPFDLRLNLIGEKPLQADNPVALSYAASADVAALRGLRLGAQAFGGLGTFNHMAPYAEHFIGPVAKIGIDRLGPEMQLQLGYLFAVSKARNDTKGQLRMALEMEF